MSVTYTVTITNPTAAGNGAGFIDATRLEHYDMTGVTLAQSQNKKRANFRFKHIVDAISMVSNVKVSDATTTGASATAEGTTFQMTVEFANVASLVITRDATTIAGALAVERLIAEAISTDQTHMCDYYAPNGPVVETAELVVGKMALDATAAMALITVA